LFVAFFLGCSPQQSLSESELEILKAEVLQATIARNSAVNAADVDLIFSLYSQAPGVIEAGGGYYDPITNATLEGLKEYYDGVENLKIDYGTPTIKILGPESAMVFLDGTWTSTVKESQEETGGPFIMTLIWIKEDGMWKVFHRHESTPAE